MVIATDLDGTLLSDSTSVSRENLDAIKRLYEAGISTVIATGRTFLKFRKNFWNVNILNISSIQTARLFTSAVRALCS